MDADPDGRRTHIHQRRPGEAPSVIGAPAQSSMLTRALAYAAAGLPVLPCVPGGKSRITAHGFHDATTDRELISMVACHA